MERLEGTLERIVYEAEEDGYMVARLIPVTDEDQLLTIHKSQGNEYKAVVMPILTHHYVMLQRNLLYTGITRAKELVVIVGSKKALGIAI